MTSIRSLSLCVAMVAAAGAPLPAQQFAQQPADDEFALQLAAILPTAAERQWLDVPWRPDLRQGLIEADRLGRPIVLWAMNGHPLGQC